MLLYPGVSSNQGIICFEDMHWGQLWVLCFCVSVPWQLQGAGLQELGVCWAECAGEWTSINLSLRGQSPIKMPFHSKEQNEINFPCCSYDCPSVMGKAGWIQAGRVSLIEGISRLISRCSGTWPISIWIIADDRVRYAPAFYLNRGERIVLGWSFLISIPQIWHRFAKHS